ncbi:MAG: hypothetical protein J5525_13070 [Lachnospiraceae bacterium]|nr:hypothetical protein [Lachnospiraceae bacterium]
MDLFDLIATGIGLILVLVGYIGYKARSSQNAGKRRNPEYTERMREHEHEVKRKSKEDKELDDYMRGTSDDYL